MKSIADELATAQTLIFDKDFLIVILDGFSEDFKLISIVLSTRETPITFKELHDKQTDYETVQK